MLERYFVTYISFTSLGSNFGARDYPDQHKSSKDKSWRHTHGGQYTSVLIVGHI